MAIKLSEDELVDVSYTSKDFKSIYPELLDLAKKLTNRWDPSISNESDPGVVLLKLSAILADKNNYNIDKSVLEAFPSSVTQYGNARELFSSMGYNMRWFKSATTDLSIFYKKNIDGNGIEVPIFTEFTDSSNTVSYTSTENSSLDAKGRIVSIPVIEGSIKSYKIGGSSTIYLNNLDADYRLYFNDRNVAENGIFVKGVGDSDWSAWSKKDNLEYESLDQKIFKFGVLPNSETCYIQFPQDMANLIGSGIMVNYIVSKGADGNISARTLTRISSDLKLGDKSVGNDDLTIFNAYSTYNGEDPENINSAYKNYKKQIGTFNTLVTCKDYESAIYYLDDDSLRANGVVSDRTNDINKSRHVMQLTLNGDRRVLQSKGNAMTAFDLGLYILRPMSNVLSRESYDDSFRPSTNLLDIQYSLNSSKSVQHDFIGTKGVGNGVYSIVNLYDLVGKVTTYYKVSEEEAKDIKNKIVSNLYKHYNSYGVEYGEPLYYDDLIDTIKSSDERIKSVILNEPIIETKKIDSMSENIVEMSGTASDVYNDLVLNGNIQYYDFNKDFNYEFGREYSGVISNVSSISTNLSILNDAIISGYKLKDNEVLQFIADNLVVSEVYTSGVEYTYSEYSDSPVSKGSIVKLSGNLNLKYKDSNNTEQTVAYSGSSNIYIRPNFDLSTTSEAVKLGTTQQIEVLRVNSTVIDSDVLKCYWILNNNDNTLFSSNSSKRLLQENEWFMYTNEDGTDLVMLGSGTQITRSVVDSANEVKIPKTISANSIVSDGLNAFNDSVWYSYTKKNLGELTITEKAVVNFPTGYTITISNRTEDISSELSTISDSNSVTYSKGTEEGSLSDIYKEGVNWEVRAVLNISTSKDAYQKIESGQTITLNPSLSGGETITSGYIQTNIPVVLSGGSNIDVRVLKEDGSISADLKVLKIANITEVNRREDGWIVSDSLPSTLTLYKPTSSSDMSYIFPIIITGAGSENILSDNSYKYKVENSDLSTTYYIQSSSSGSVSLSLATGASTSNLSFYIGVPKLKVDKSDESDSALYSLITSTGFDSTYEIKEEDEIESYGTNVYPESFYDVNNPYRKFTISKINSINIDIAKSSKL